MRFGKIRGYSNDEWISLREREKNVRRGTGKIVKEHEREGQLEKNVWLRGIGEI